VFTNLVSNALKYSPSHETISVNIETESEGHLVRIVVSDKGPGISKTDLSELFTLFFRSSKLVALEREGTGLGLFLSRSIVEEHGGTLAASSTIGAGSKFTVDLPIDASSLDVEAA
jgi:signal transduction histidine kinase